MLINYFKKKKNHHYLYQLHDINASIFFKTINTKIKIKFKIKIKNRSKNKNINFKISHPLYQQGHKIMNNITAEIETI